MMDMVGDEEVEEDLERFRATWVSEVQETLLCVNVFQIQGLSPVENMEEVIALVVQLKSVGHHVAHACHLVGGVRAPL